MHETSPYLLQHAHNPVNWYPWGDEAFEKARKENKPVILSIGYSTCHWCHVMEHESFEDVEIAQFMNDHFVSIKVDREQRPDIDSVYMAVVQAMTGHGGWPMTVWLTPDREPFYGGTYFPARQGDRGNHPGFLQMLERLSELYQQNTSEITERAKQITQDMKNHMQQTQAGDLPTISVFDKAFEELSRSYDSRYGGFGFAPKFPRPSTLQFLFHYGALKNNEKATRMAVHTLKAMLQGGIFDQIGGGFHRYSVDAYWLVSHFEKMLYDQSQIVLSMLDAYQITADPEFKRGVDETLGYILREMTSPDGAFYSATDADSEGVEGKFFIWSPEEIVEVLGEQDAQTFIEYYGVTPHGNFEEKNIFFITQSLEEFAQKKSWNVEETIAKFETWKKKMWEERNKRIPPLTDDKIIVSWNGLMISAMARAGFVLKNQGYIDAATKAVQHILGNLIQDGQLYRSFRKGQVSAHAFLDDYACLIHGLLELFEVTGHPRWLNHAITLQNQMIQKFWDNGLGGFYSSSENTMFLREKPFYDGAEPSGNSIAAWNLLRFSSLLKDESYRNHAQKIFELYSSVIENNPTYLPQMLTALDYFHSSAKEIVAVDALDGKFRNLLDVLRQTYLPNRVIVQADASLAQVVPSLSEKLDVKKSTVYVCQGYVCQAPARDAETLSNKLKNIVARIQA
ncbi:MAG: thioredoxin domain-containing protein [Bdellovibrionota bacterium]